MTADIDKKYFEDALSWDIEIYQNAQKKAKNYAALSAILLILLFLCLVIIALLVPLKTVEPYVVQVDRASGMVEVKRPLKESGVQAISESEAITKFFINQYIIAREGYLYDTYVSNYKTVQKMSSSKIAQEYTNWFNDSNEESPLNIYKNVGQVKIEVRSLSFIDENTVSVPILRIEKKYNKTIESYQVVTLSFKYLQNPKKQIDRLVNPLGFQVTSYNVDEQMIKES